MMQEPASCDITKWPHFAMQHDFPISREPIVAVARPKQDNRNLEEQQMIGLVETLRETFTLYLAAGVIFSAASIWAAVKAVRSDSNHRPR
jgi:hypothetical protein